MHVALNNPKVKFYIGDVSNYDSIDGYEWFLLRFSGSSIEHDSML